MNHKLSSIAGIVLAALSASAHADAGSSVAIWGVMDAGITAVSNVKGGRTYLKDNGISSPNLWGIRGSEDLGGGTHAVFELVDQFNAGTGAIYPTNGGALFGRNAYVGLQNDGFGKVTLGQQYDFMIDTLLPFDNSIYVAGLYGFREGPFSKLGIPGNSSGDANFDRMSGTSMSNAVKYTSVNYGGLKFGAMYSFGGVAGSVAADSGESFGLSYANGPFSFGLAYTDQRYAALDNGLGSIRNFGGGAAYKIGQAAFNFLYTNTKNTVNGATINVYQIGTRYQLTPAWSVGGDYELMKGNAALASDKANQFSLGTRYSLSKRTMVYAEGVYQKVSGDDNPQAQIMAIASPSSNGKQLVARIGIQHRF